MRPCWGLLVIQHTLIKSVMFLKSPLLLELLTELLKFAFNVVKYIAATFRFLYSILTLVQSLQLRCSCFFLYTLGMVDDWDEMDEEGGKNGSVFQQGGGSVVVSAQRLYAALATAAQMAMEQQQVCEYLSSNMIKPHFYTFVYFF